MCEEGDVHCVHMLSSQVHTNVVEWVDQLEKFLFSCMKHQIMLLCMTADGASGCQIGGMQRSVTKLPTGVLRVPKFPR